MGGLSAGSDAFFSVSPAELAKPECFAVRRGDNLERLDVRFNHPEYGLWRGRLAAAPGETPELGSLLLSIASGATPKRSDESLYAAEGIRFFRILNVGDGEILERDLKYITEEVHNGDLERSQLESGDVLLTITGRVGSAAVVQSEHLPANINQHIARLRVDRERCRPEFLREWLNCPAGLALSNHPTSGGTRPALDYSAVRRIRVPLPDLAEQDRLVAVMDAARAERRDKMAAADQLLAGLDDFVLEALGIERPAADGRRVFAVRLIDTAQPGQLNADYYHPERIAAVRVLNRLPGVRASAALSEVVDFERQLLKTPGENYLGLAQVQSHTGELTDTTDKTAGNSYAYQEEDVLFARLRPYLNKVHRAETAGSCSTEFHVLRVKDRESLSPEYLAAILRSRLVLAQTVHMMAGNTHPRLTDRDVADLRIPIPDMETQEALANEIIRRREESRWLRAEAESGWQAAKAWFEGELLGGTV